jgi:hypothetical protein
MNGAAPVPPAVFFVEAVLIAPSLVAWRIFASNERSDAGLDSFVMASMAEASGFSPSGVVWAAGLRFDDAEAFAWAARGT